MSITRNMKAPGISIPARAPASEHGSRRIAHAPAQGGEVLTTRVGLQIPPGLNFETWEHAGRTLAGIVDSSSWWLGDWLVYGKDNYADRYERGIRAAGLKYQTLRNYAWVSRRFEFGRRRARLSFQHHAEVASLMMDAQERWLDEAEQMNWTTKQLRQAVQSAREGEVNGGERPHVTRRLEVPDNRFRRWHKAAEHSGIDLEKWVLATLDGEAERTLENLETLADQPEISA
ncbi:LmbU family transcriptional regulator [Streptomyces sp. NPDC007095]|uniref:LmbU family transcriptional regulator n=1 Tax=Streptomyces sp. NPDC007095 TaxID=3154482 RepID=UPI000CAA62D3